MTESLNKTNFRKFAKDTIASYDKKGMIVDAMLWGAIIRHYENELKRKPKLRATAVQMEPDAESRMILACQVQTRENKRPRKTG